MKYFPYWQGEVIAPIIRKIHALREFSIVGGVEVSHTPSFELLSIDQRSHRSREGHWQPTLYYRHNFSNAHPIQNR